MKWKRCLFAKWKLIVKLIGFNRFHCSIKLNKKKRNSKTSWNEFIIFVWFSLTLKRIEKNEKNMRNRMIVWWEEHHNFLPSHSLSISVSLWLPIGIPSTISLFNTFLDQWCCDAPSIEYLMKNRAVYWTIRASFELFILFFK